MSDLFSAILGTACICASTFAFIRICAKRGDLDTPYVILKKDDYESLLQKAAVIKEQPPPIPPVYSEIAPLLPAAHIPT